jgi:hypothetical protein
VSFDIDPKDKYQRFLLYHAESDSIFEVFSEAEKDNIIGSEPLCMDVTGDIAAEEKFKNEQDEKRKEGSGL